MAPTLTDVAATLASLYVTAPTLDLTPAQKGSFLLAVDDEYASLPFWPCVISNDPKYSGWESMAADIRENGKLLVDDRHAPSYFSREDNAKLRAVHDYHHVLSESGFDFAGELKAFAHQAASSESSIHTAILFSEVVLQAAYTTTHGSFPAQRLVSCSTDLIHSAIRLGETL